MYVDFEDAFQDDTTNHDYFGFQPPPGGSSSTDYPLNDMSQPANFYLQSVETISEVKNTNFSPFIRYQASRESSRPSTPSDTVPYHLRSNPRSQPSPQNGGRPPPHTSALNGLSKDLTRLNLGQKNDGLDADAVRLKLKEKQPYDDTLLVSSQFKLILPQYFLVKYLGRTICSQLWGEKAVRGPIDEMVHAARKFPSMSEIPTLEATVNPRGLTLTHRQAPTRSSKRPNRSPSPERHQHGLIPLEYISYVMHDMKYSKISTCIVLRQSKSSSNEAKSNNDMVTECYGFLFQSKEHAHRFALSLAEAFNAQKHSSRATRTHHHQYRSPERRAGAERGHSPPRRSRHRPGASGHHHHERTRAGKYDDSYLRDSEV